MARDGFRQVAAVLLATLCAVQATGTSYAREPANLTVIAFAGVAEDETIPGSERPLRPDESLPYRVERTCYGWMMRFLPVNETLELDERLTIPGAAPQWNSLDDTNVAADRASAVTRITVDGTTGVAVHSWCVARGDPEGQYRFDVSQGGRLLGSISFRVERPAI